MPTARGAAVFLLLIISPPLASVRPLSQHHGALLGESAHSPLSRPRRSAVSSTPGSLSVGPHPSGSFWEVVPASERQAESWSAADTFTGPPRPGSGGHHPWSEPQGRPSQALLPVAPFSVITPLPRSSGRWKHLLSDLAARCTCLMGTRPLKRAAPRNQAVWCRRYRRGNWQSPP